MAKLSSRMQGQRLRRELNSHNAAQPRCIAVRSSCATASTENRCHRREVIREASWVTQEPGRGRRSKPIPGTALVQIPIHRAGTLFGRPMQPQSSHQSVFAGPAFVVSASAPKKYSRQGMGHHGLRAASSLQARPGRYPARNRHVWPLCLTLPNPSLKPSPNGGPPGPRGGSGYHPPRGPGVPPLGPA